MKNENGMLLHRYRGGEAGLNANIDDYAFLISALLDLYESSFKTDYLKTAIELNNHLIKHFWDEKIGGFFFTADYSEELIIRQKEIYDGAVPSGNSAAMLNLLRIGRITGVPEYERKAAAIGMAFSKTINSVPSAFTHSLIALDFAFGPSYEIVIAGNENISDSEMMIEILRKQYLPNKTVLFKPQDKDEITDIAQFTLKLKSLNGAATVYVCQNYNCKMPITDCCELEKLLEEL